VPHNFSATHFSSRFWPLSGPDDVETLWTSGPTRSDRLCCRSAIKKPSASRYFRLFVTNSLRLPNTPLETILYFFELRIRKTLRRNYCAAELPAAHFYRNFQPLRLTSHHMKYITFTVLWIRAEMTSLLPYPEPAHGARANDGVGALPPCPRRGHLDSGSGRR
jgi:hypothetical protein